MQDLVKAIVLGVVQAVGEFLPISSSAHLIIVPWFLGWPAHSLSFDVALHIGTLFAVLVYFFRDILILINGFFQSIRYKNIHYSEDSKLGWLIIIATIPAVVFGLFFEHYVEELFRSPPLIAAMLLIFALFLFFADKYGLKTRGQLDLNFKFALLVGMAQSLSIIPGVSRSGVTITMALFLGFDRYFAARFSFLLSIPIIAGAAVMHLKKIFIVNDINFFVGIMVSFIVGLVVIKYFLKFVQNKSYLPFVLYRIAIAMIIIIWNQVY